MPTNSLYRALLDVSSAIVEQPTVKAVLHSLRDVLASSCRLHGIDIYVLGSGGDIALDLQPKILRALQEQEFKRLGSTKTIHVDVRLIAATHPDLDGMIRNNQFREDLFYRLNVFPVEIPPLRERREDIPLLVHYFVLRHSRQMQRRKSVPKKAMEQLVNHNWPGNIRELENFIERCVIFPQGDELNVPRAELTKAPVRQATSAASSFEQAERQVIVDALRAASGGVSAKAGPQNASD